MHCHTAPGAAAQQGDVAGGEDLSAADFCEEAVEAEQQHGGGWGAEVKGGGDLGGKLWRLAGEGDEDLHDTGG